MGEVWEEADLCSLALAGTHTKYRFPLILGDTNQMLEAIQWHTHIKIKRQTKKIHTKKQQQQPKENDMKRKKHLLLK